MFKLGTNNNIHIDEINGVKITIKEMEDNVVYVEVKNNRDSRHSRNFKIRGCYEKVMEVYNGELKSVMENNHVLYMGFYLFIWNRLTMLHDEI